MERHNGVARIQVRDDRIGLGLPPSPKWMERAACRGAETSLFFPRRNPEGGRNAAIEKYCQGCPVIKQCGKFGADTNSVGIWGGAWRMSSDGDPSDD